MTVFSRSRPSRTEVKMRLIGLSGLAPGSRHSLRIERPDGEVLDIQLEHSLTAREVEW